MEPIFLNTNLPELIFYKESFLPLILYIKLFYCIYFISDNPLLCDCELQWYKNWLRNLKDKDDEMMQKKRTVCTMQHEHREYSLQSLPLDKMKCKIKSYENSAYSSADTQIAVSKAVLSLSIFVLARFLLVSS